MYVSTKYWYFYFHPRGPNTASDPPATQRFAGKQLCGANDLAWPSRADLLLNPERRSPKQSKF